jgi:hypothetical protein
VTALHIERKACSVELSDSSRWRMTPHEDGECHVALPNAGLRGQDWVVRLSCSRVGT